MNSIYKKAFFISNLNCFYDEKFKFTCKKIFFHLSKKTFFKKKR